MTTGLHIFISAGEASGDLLGANLAKAIITKSPNTVLTGMGGQRMRSAGVDLKVDSKRLAVVGLFEIITHLPDIWLTLRRIKQHLKTSKPDLVILIDFPDTHFIISKMAKKLGIPVLYYVSPQIWAWRSGRIKHIQKYIDHMAVLFAFEEKLYQRAGVPVDWVGHPLIDIVKPTMTPQESFNHFELDCNKRIIALFPGSRHSEVSMHLPILIETAKLIRASHSDVQFVIPLANSIDAALLNETPDWIIICRGHLYDLLQITHCALAVSGTVTLEIALMQVPLCILYKLKPLTYQIANKFINVEHIGLCNIVAEETVAKEFVQQEANPQALSDGIKMLLNNEELHQQQQDKLQKVRQNLGPGNGAEKVANIALRMCNPVNDISKI